MFEIGLPERTASDFRLNTSVILAATSQNTDGPVADPSEDKVLL